MCRWLRRTRSTAAKSDGLDRTDDPGQEHQAVDEDGVGQDPQPPELDEHRGVTEEGQPGEWHLVSASGRPESQGLGRALVRRGRRAVRAVGAFGPGSCERVKITNGRSGPRVTVMVRALRTRLAPVTRST